MKAAGLTVDATDASSEMVRVANELFAIDAKVARFQDIDCSDQYDGIWATLACYMLPKMSSSTYFRACTAR